VTIFSRFKYRRSEPVSTTMARTPAVMRRIFFIYRDAPCPYTIPSSLAILSSIGVRTAIKRTVFALFISLQLPFCEKTSSCE
jgi:hypothetical protein